MNKFSRILIAVASLMMIPSLFLALWNIDLGAPQYPEGLSMQIWLTKITGDVNTINGLNHYIGMKHIKVEMFPEFGYMQYIVIAFIISGILTSILGKKTVLIIWFGIFFCISAYGIYDFWSWEYDYGHNLDPTAAIKVEGMSYQPPLIGCKQLLNFTACCYPAAGGILIISAGSLSFLVTLFTIFTKKKIVA